MKFVLGIQSVFSSLLSLCVSIFIFKFSYCKATIKESWRLRNPFGCIHAAALVNFGEAVTAFAVLGYCESQDHHFKGIVTKIEADYLKKARGKLTGICTFGGVDPADSEKVVADLMDEKGQIVAKVGFLLIYITDHCYLDNS